MGGTRYNGSGRDESTGQQLQSKHQDLCTLHGIVFRYVHELWENLCTDSMLETSGTNHAIMPYITSLDPRSTVASRCQICGTVTLRQAHLPAGFEGNRLTSCRRGSHIETCFLKAAKSDNVCIKTNRRGYRL